MAMSLTDTQPLKIYEAKRKLFLMTQKEGKSLEDYH
jgi:hypothetical protein